MTVGANFAQQPYWFRPQQTTCPAALASRKEFVPDGFRTGILAVLLLDSDLWTTRSRNQWKWFVDRSLWSSLVR